MPILKVQKYFVFITCCITILFTASVVNATYIRYEGLGSNNSGNLILSPSSGSVGVGALTQAQAVMHLASSSAATMFRVDDGGEGDTSPFIIDGAGNVGIGTTGPNGILHTYQGASGQSPSTNGDGLVIEDNARTGLSILTPSNQWGHIYFGDEGSAVSGEIRYQHAEDSMDFSTASTTAMTIDNTGNVGIGTTAPTRGKLVVNANSGHNNNNAELLVGGTYDDPTVNSNYGQVYIFSNDALGIDKGGIISFGGIYQGSTDTRFAAIHGGKDTATTGETGGYLRLLTRTNGMVGPAERVRITSAGNVGIGTTAPGTYAAIPAKLEVANATSHSVIAINSKDDTKLSALTFAHGGVKKWNIETTASADPDLRFTDNASTQVMTLQDGGKVGIGTTGPEGQFEVFKDNGVGNVDSSFLVDFDGANSNRRLTVSNVGGTGMSIQADTISTDIGTDLVLNPAGGNVGIGTTAPSRKLEVNISEDNWVTRLRATGFGYTDWSWRSVESRTEAGAVSAFAINPNGGNVGIGTTGPGAKLDIQGGALRVHGGSATTDIEFKRADGWNPATISQLYNTAAYGGDLAFKVHPADNVLATAPVTAMYIKANGNVGIGTTNPGAKLEAAKGSIGTYMIVGGDDSSNARALEFISTTTTGVGDTHTLNAKSVSGEMAFAITGEEAMRIDNNGNVGIGTTNPGAKLSILGAQSANSVTEVLRLGVDTGQQQSGPGSYISFRDIDVYEDAARIVSQRVGLGTGSVLKFEMRTGSSAIDERMRIDSAGNVGIGTTAPQNPLHIVRAVDSPQLRVAYSGTDYVELLHRGRFNIVTTAESTNFYDFRRNGASDMVIKQGNVGIGTTEPDHELEVEDTTGTSTIMISAGATVTAGASRLEFKAHNASGGFVNRGSIVVDQDVAGNNSTAKMTFSTSPTGGLLETPRMTIDSTGNVGIGTTAPGSKLDVAGNIQLQGEADSEIGFEYNGGQFAKIVGDARSGSPLYGDLDFYTDNGGGSGLQERLTIRADGNVGIGTTGPGVKLDIKNDDSNTNFNSGVNSMLRLENTNSTAGNFAGIDFYNGNTGSAYIYGVFDRVGTNDGSLAFATRNTSNSAYERMRITSTGNVGIGTTAPGAKLHLSGGDGSNAFTAAIIALGYSTTGQYPHFIHTRHNSSALTGNAIDFYTGDRTAAGVFPTNAVHGMTIESGNVGIGTTGPSEKLHISLEDVSNYNSSAIMTGVPGLLLENTSNNNDGVAQLSFKGMAVSAWNAAIGAEGNTGVADLYFQVGSTGAIKEAMRLQGDGDVEIMNGNVGIGTTAPSTSLVLGGSRPIYFDPGKTVGVSDGVLLQGSTGGWVTGYGFMGSGGTELGGFQALGNTDGLTRYFIGTYSTDEKVSILSNGNVGIGTTGPGVALQVVGVGQATLGFSTGSDKRWKKNITPLKSALNMVMKLQGVNYNFRIAEFPELKFSAEPQIGLIAQDVEKIVPEVVSTINGFKSIDYGKLTTVLIEAIKEQQKQIEELKSAIKVLQAKQ